VKWINKIHQGDVLEVLSRIPSDMVDCVITSPPYWSLRDYQLEPQIWDGDKNCEHDFNIESLEVPTGKGGNWQQANNGPGLTKGKDQTRFKGDCKKANESQKITIQRGFCSLCGAWRGSLGLEPTFELYLQHLIQIFDEVKRVLKPTGTCFVNIGDSYANSSHPGGGDPTIQKRNLGGVEYPKKPLSGIQRKSLYAIPERFKIMMIDRGWICRNTIIWHKRNCLCGSTTLYASTQKGVMPSTLKDLIRLKPGTVQLWDGEKWQKVKKWVKNIAPKNIKDITFRNGETIKCTGDHLFPLISGEIKKASELSVGDIIKNTILPVEEKIVEYIPNEMGWFLGTYLADGSLGDNGRCIQISSHTKEQERFLKLRYIAQKYDGECRSFNREGNSSTFNIYSKVLISIIKTYIGGGSAKDKHLNNISWQRHNDFLYEMLMGYLEGDGHYDKKNNRYRLGFCRNNHLARDLRIICSRLGHSIKLQKTYTKLNGKKFNTYKGEIRLSVSNHHNIKSDYEIVKIKKGKNVGYFWDVVLEKEPHLFASHSGLLIHNCLPNSAKDRFTVDYEPVHFFVKNYSYWFEQQFEPNMDSYNGERGNNLIRKKMQSAMRTKSDKDYYGLGRNKRCIWDVPTQPFSEAHFATFSEKLVEPMIRAGCPEFICKECGRPREKILEQEKAPEELYTKSRSDDTGFVMSGWRRNGVRRGAGQKFENWRKEHPPKVLGYTDCGCNGGWKAGIVLDPFMGSGTVAKVAKKLKRNWIGIELSEKYIELANKRIKNVQMELF